MTNGVAEPPPPLTDTAFGAGAPRLAGLSGRLQCTLERKGQAILYGPPGTGKSYWAVKTARDLISFREFGVSYDHLDAGHRELFKQTDLVRVCSFHPAFAYEHFVESYRPENLDGHIVYAVRDGLFKNICLDALQRPDYLYFLIIDEINRGDVSQIFGELLTLLEKTKRGSIGRLPVSGKQFQVPRNVFIIGTMNSADQSITQLDKAFRRRFGFIECMPDSEVFQGIRIEGLPLGPWLGALNKKIVRVLGAHARQYQIGHAYLMEGGRPITKLSAFMEILQDDIIPLLEDYTAFNYEQLATLIGPRLVDVEGQTVHHEFFVESRKAELIQSLLEPYPELVPSRAPRTASANPAALSGEIQSSRALDSLTSALAVQQTEPVVGVV